MCNLYCVFGSVWLVCSVLCCHFVDILIVTRQETADEDPPRANPAAMPQIKKHSRLPLYARPYTNEI